MPRILDYFNTPWVATVVGLIGVVLAIFFFIRGRVIRRLAYQATGSNLIGGQHAELPVDVAVVYKGVPVPRVTKTTLIIWNAGNTTLDGRDIVSTDPLRIALEKDCKILDIQVVKRSRGVTGILASSDDRFPASVLVTCDFLDSGDGARMEVLHTGDSGLAVVVGTVKGLRKGCVSFGSIPPHDRSHNRGPLASKDPMRRLLNSHPALLFGLMVLAGLAGVIGGLFPDLVISLFPPLGKSDTSSVLSPGRINWLPLILGLLYATPGGAMLWLVRMRYPRELDGGQHENSS